MAIGQVPVQVMCDVMDGFKLHVEDVDGVGVPKMSMAFSMKMSFPIHDLLKTLVSWQEHETGYVQEEPAAQRAVVDEESRRRAQEACKAAENPSTPLVNAPSYAEYKTQNNWEQISCPNVVVLNDEQRLREATFTTLPLPERVEMTYAKFREDRSKSGADLASGASLGKWPQMKAPPPQAAQAPEKAPPLGWRTPPAAVKPVPPVSVQHKPPPAGKAPPRDARG
ncbi:unnamed protein product [Symbiodinium pilosum]|uniref:Uncharacterized protein n=1 Tax=Symbiodinium pilosum TaxID=2952 RepID=A0A812NSE2_SYMPI|nr:unnamed protein product [Symbiodinium pilosum]